MDKDQIIKEQLATLPRQVREVIASNVWATTTDSIAEQYYLDGDLPDKLKTEVVLAIIGLEDIRDLAKNITEHLELPTDFAEQITGSISRQVLPPLVDAWTAAAAAEPEPIDPLIAMKEKLIKISQQGRFPINTLTSRFETLPKKAQEAITGPELAKVMAPIAHKYDLHVDQGGQLAEITILVMLGLIKTTEFIGELEKGLGLTKIKAGDIAYEIDQKLFKPMREVLKNTSPAKTDDQGAKAVPLKEQYPADLGVPNVPSSEPTKNQELAVDKKQTIDPYREPIE